ncbi:MAG: amidohydrolase family protein [Victivallaceae bacterium]|nr:amidohydrolase family protein [Victivallaceae bacterium]
MVIDFHTHYYPDNIVERAMANARSLFGMEPAADGTRAGLVASMRRAGIDYSLALPLANTPDNIRGVNRWAQLNNQPPVFLLGSIHPRAANPAAVVSRLAAMGFKGLKMHPEYQDFSFEDESLEPIWESCIANDLFVLTHAGRDIAFPAPYRSDPRRLEAFHKRFPELKLVLAHLGSWGMWDEVEARLAGLPVCLDLAFTLGAISDEQLIRIIRKHGAERILFGTDSPWCDQDRALRHFRGLPLTGREKELILGENAAQLLKLAV